MGYPLEAARSLKSFRRFDEVRFLGRIGFRIASTPNSSLFFEKNLLTELRKENSAPTLPEGRGFRAEFL